MKKKVLTMGLVTSLAATAVVGGTLAYFTDTDAQTNTFTFGNVAIDLFEDFGDNDEKGVEHLVPAVIAEDGTVKNAINKEVFVTNTGTEEAFVRVHIAIPKALDEKIEGKDYTALTVLRDKDNNWAWGDAYELEIDDIDHNVYPVTYGIKLDPNDTTVDAIDTVYMNPKVTNEDVVAIKGKLGAEWNIRVVAEAAQVDGFTNAADALNAAFGDPTENYKATFEGENVTEKNLRFTDSNAVKGN